MKQIVNVILSALAPFASVPTGWAIYAGMTEQPAFPMLEPIAIIGAVAVIASTAAAALLVVDVLKHNQGAQSDEEKKLNLSIWSAWAILIGCIAGEILLSLVIVIIPGWLAYGVLAFPLMTLAGVFAFALRMSLGERMREREELRTRHAQEAADLQAKLEAEEAERKAEEKAMKEQARAERKARQLERQAAKLAGNQAQIAPENPQVAQQVARKAVTDDDLLAYLAANPGESHKQVAAHFGVSRQAIGQRVKKLYEVKQ